MCVCLCVCMCVCVVAPMGSEFPDQGMNQTLSCESAESIPLEHQEIPCVGAFKDNVGTLSLQNRFIIVIILFCGSLLINVYMCVRI